MTAQQKNTATTSLLVVMEGIRKFFPHWPPVLPSETDSRVRPLAIGIDKNLASRMVVPDGISKIEADTQVQRAIRYLVRSYAYHRAVAAHGAMRHDIDGHPVEPVTSEQAKHASRQLPEFQQSIRASVEKSTGAE